MTSGPTHDRGSLSVHSVTLKGSFGGSESAFPLGVYLQQHGGGQEELLSQFTDCQASRSPFADSPNS